MLLTLATKPVYQAANHDIRHAYGQQDNDQLDCFECDVFHVEIIRNGSGREGLALPRNL